MDDSFQNADQTRLVVGPQQGGAIRSNQGLPHIVLQVRKFRHPHDNVQIRIQDNILAVIVCMDLGLDIFSIEVGRIHMGDKANSWRLLMGR